MENKEKIRIKFTKGEEIRFVSHLDMVQVFTRAMRRARLPVSFSEGFVPREKISFSPPLPLGLTSKGEYADIEFSVFINPKELEERLNRELPPGLEIKEAKIIPLKSRSLMATFNCAEYEAKLPLNRIQDLGSRIQDLLKRREILIKRETPKGIKEIDIRPSILELELKDSTLRMLLRIEVRPQEVVRALLNLSREETLKLSIERKDLLRI